MLVGGAGETDKGDQMGIPRGKFEWNLNTLGQLIGFGSTLVALGVVWGTFSSKVAAMDANDVRLESRVSKNEVEIKRIDNLAYRITAVEQSQVSSAEAINDVKNLVNEQGADLRVVREILEQLREAQGLPRRSGK